MSGHNQEIEGAYIESDKFKEMNAYAQKKLKESVPKGKEYNEERDPYNIIINNCGTFASDVIKQDEGLKTPIIIDPRPVSIVKEYQSKFTPVTYNRKQGTIIKDKERETVKPSDKPTPKKKQE